MTQVIALALLLLIFVVITAVIVLTVYIVKLIIDLNKLTNNLNDVAIMVKRDVQPIIKDVQVTLNKLNELAQAADNQMSTLKKIIATIVGFSTLTIGSMKNISSSFIKGLMSGFKMFSKR